MLQKQYEDIQAQLTKKINKNDYGNRGHGYETAILCAKSMLSASADVIYVIDNLPNKLRATKKLKPFDEGYNEGIIDAISILKKIKSEGINYLILLRAMVNERETQSIAKEVSHSTGKI